MAAQEQKRFTGGEARQLLRAARQGSLATLTPEGAPYASFVSFATALDGSPILFISKLAWHTRHLEADGRASLLVTGDMPAGDALAGARVSVLGRFARVAREEAAGRYLARHPEASLYIDFADFSFWRMGVEAVHAVAGFGRIETLPGAEVVLSPEACARFAAETGGAAEHMNAEHKDALALYAGRPGEWLAAGLDPDGMDMVCGQETARLAFPEVVNGGGQLRKLLAELARAARQSATS